MYPSILQRAINRDFANRNPFIRETCKNTFMVAAGNLCIYYILNADHSDIIDIQVD